MIHVLPTQLEKMKNHSLHVSEAMHQGQNVVFWLLVVLGLPDAWRKDITHTLSNITLVHWVVFTKSK